MQKNDLEGLLERISDLQNAFHDVHNELRREFPKLYDRWKAGGCAVSDDFLSMYPSIGEIEEQLQEELEEFCPECEEKPCICEDENESEKVTEDLQKIFNGTCEEEPI